MPTKPWYAHYEGDYLLDTAWFHCAAQHGIYRAILARLNLQGPIDDVDDELRAIARANPDEWAAYWPAIRARFLFLNADGRIDQKRASQERRKSGKINKRLSNAGAAGAAARWGKKTSPPAGEPATGDTPAAPAPEKRATAQKSGPADEVLHAVDLYNEMAREVKLPECQRPSPARMAKLARRLKDAGGIDGWKAALEKVKASSFCTGAKTNWRADIDFMLQESKFAKILEGAYDDTNPTGGRPKPPTDAERRASILDGLADIGMDGRAGIAPGPDESTH